MSQYLSCPRWVLKSEYFVEVHYTVLLLRELVFATMGCKSDMVLVECTTDDFSYVLRQYGHKQNQNTQLHTITLLLERVKGQKSIEELASVPTPSQMDNWTLFEKHEGDLIKKVRGLEAFREWRIGKAHEKIERIRAMDPLAELTQGLNLVKPRCVGIKD